MKDFREFPFDLFSVFSTRPSKRSLWTAKQRLSTKSLFELCSKGQKNTINHFYFVFLTIFGLGFGGKELSKRIRMIKMNVQ